METQHDRDMAELKRKFDHTRLYRSGIMGYEGNYEIDIRRKVEDPEAALSSSDGHVCTVTNSRLPAHIESMSDEMVKRWNVFPELLAALIALRTANGSDDFEGWHPSFRDAIDMARAALSKATK